MTASASDPQKPEFWEETGSGFRMSVYKGPAGGFWPEVHHEGRERDSPMLYQGPSMHTSEAAAFVGRAFVAGAAFLAADAADAIASAAGEDEDEGVATSTEEEEVASISIFVSAPAARRVLRRIMR